MHYTDEDVFRGLDNVLGDVHKAAIGKRKNPRPTDEWWDEVGQLPDLEFQPPDLSSPEAIRDYSRSTHRAMYHDRLNRATKPRTGKTPEAKVTKEGNKYLSSRGVLMVRINQGTFKVVDPDGDTRYISGPPVGTHDWLGCLPTGRFLSVEYKGTNQPTDKQRSFQAQVVERGGLSLVVWDVERDLKPAVEAELAKKGTLS